MSAASYTSASAQLASAPADLGNYTPRELRQIVLDHLSHCCYADTAIAFANEIDDANRDAAEIRAHKSAAAIETQSTLSQQAKADLKRRKDIREYLLSGRVVKAMEVLQEHYPAVLPPSPSTSKRASFGDSNTIESLFVPMHIRKRYDSTDAEQPWSRASLSLDPAIISLNLQSQAFVEVIRTAASAPSIGSPSSSMVLGNSTTTADGMSNSTSSIVSTRTSNMLQAITLSQALHSAVRDLPAGPVKDEWEQQCIDVSALMAYKNLDECPTKGYLHQSRRVVLAELVNAAILHHCHGKTAMPYTSLVTRQTTTVWQALAEWKLIWPPIPPGQTRDKLRSRTYPRFDLETYLNEHESNAEGVAERQGR